MITRLDVSIANQSLTSFDEQGTIIREYGVSTARNGPGQNVGSECTPLGRHRVRAKIGAESAINTVFVGRRATGEIYSEALALNNPERDWILTRILWLSGEEPGFNRLGRVDTMRRYIYIHGAPDSHQMGIPSSHGCIKMSNADLIDLFNQTVVNTKVNIHNG